MRAYARVSLRFGHLMLIAWLFLSSAFAQQPPPVPPAPLQPPQPPARLQIQPQVQPGTAPMIIGPGGRLNTAGGDEITPAASAAFDVQTARIGRPFEYRVTITGSQRVTDLPGLKAPEGLQFEQGARGYSLTPLNGELVSMSTLRFNVMPLRTGDFTVPAFQVQVGTKQVQVPAVRIAVTDLPAGEAAYQPVRAVLDMPKRDYFVGETINARLLFIETPDEMPQFIQHVAKASGEVLFKPSMRTRARETLEFEGKQVRGLTMPVQITPIVAGESAVGCQVIVHVARTARFGGGFSSQATLDTPTVNMRVLALPQAGRPKGFTGAIGKFTIAQPTLSANETEVGEPIALMVALRGEGNLDSVPPPELEANAEWTNFRPTSSFERDENGEGGTKTFTYTLVPKQEGRRGTPALPFAYFDPEKRTFVDITVPPLPVVVKPSPNAASTPVADATKKEPTGPTEPPREAEPVLTGLAEKSGRWASSPAPNLRAFLLWQLAPPVVLLLLWAWRKRFEHLLRHPETLRRRRARAATRAALAKARAAAKRGDQAGFFQAGLGALREAAAPLDSAQAESLTRDEVLRQLDDDERASKAARTIFETAEAARYASGAGVLPQPSALLPELERAVARLGARA
jgi:hypothetical protein